MVIAGSVNQNATGTNLLNYSVADSSGNPAAQQRVVLVVTKPAISILGAQLTGSNPATGARNLTVSLSFNPNGLAGAFAFQYGLDTGYAGATAPMPVAASFLTASLAQPFSNLASSVTYHFRALGANPSGTNISADFTFFIPAPYPTGDLNGDGRVDAVELSTVFPATTVAIKPSRW